jgi:hypothetical protein
VDRFDNLSREIQELREDVCDRLGNIGWVMEEWWKQECHQDQSVEHYAVEFRAMPEEGPVDVAMQEGDGVDVAEGSGTSGVPAEILAALLPKKYIFACLLLFVT